MIESLLEGVESLRVMRAEGNCRIVGADAPPIRVRCERYPEVRREGGLAEILLLSDAQLELPPGVALELFDCAGNLAIEGFEGSLTLGRVGGNLDARRIGSASIRGDIAGSVEVQGAKALEGLGVKGSLRVDRAASVKFAFVAGNAECAAIEREVAVERVGGRLRLEAIGGKSVIRSVGDRLEASDVATLEADSVGGKLRAAKVRGELAIGKVGGKASVDDVGGRVAIGLVAGHAGIRSARGDVELPEVRGAVNLRGGFEPGRSWRIKSGGRIKVELPRECSLEVEATARWGRVRLYGVDGELHWSGRDRVAGTIGGGDCKLTLETTGADIILESEAASAGRWEDWARHRNFRAQFEEFTENLGTEIPELVSGIVDAAGKLVSETGAISSGLMREVAKSVTEGLCQVERGLDELEKAVPEKVAAKLSQLGRQINDVVSEAVREGRCRWREEKTGARERAREEATRMREEMRASSGGRREGETAAPAEAGSRESRPESEQLSSTEQEVLKILAAVKAGKLEPAEADDLISALMELERSESGPRQGVEKP